MRIQFLDKTNKKPLANTKVQLQVKGKDSGFLTFTTDATGFIQIDEKYNGQQLSLTGQAGAGTVTAANGAILYVTGATTTAGGKTSEKAKYSRYEE